VFGYQAIYGGNSKDAVLIVGGVHVNNVAVILDYGLTSVLLFMAAKSFKRVLKSNEHQLQFVFQARAAHLAVTPRLQVCLCAHTAPCPAAPVCSGSAAAHVSAIAQGVYYYPVQMSILHQLLCIKTDFCLAAGAAAAGLRVHAGVHDHHVHGRRPAAAGRSQVTLQTCLTGSPAKPQRQSLDNCLPILLWASRHICAVHSRLARGDGHCCVGLYQTTRSSCRCGTRTSKQHVRAPVDTTHSAGGRRW